MELPPGANAHAKRVLTAVFSGDLPELQQAYAENPLEFSQPGVGAMLLNVACREGRPEVVAWLLGLGCDPNEPYRGEVPLIVALGWDTATFKGLVARDLAAATLLLSFAQQGRTTLTAEMISSLAQSGLGSRIAELAFSPTAPDILARKAQVVDLLLTHGADVRAAAGTALIAQAVRTGFDGALVHRLIDAGANPSFTDANLRANALHIAAYQGNLSAATALLDRGVRLETLSFPLPPDFPRLRNEPSGGGNTPLMCAITRGQIAMVRLLLARGADPNQSNRHLCTALHFAAPWPNSEIVSLLLAARARPDVANLDGVTPLHFAAFKGRVENARLLCDAGASLERVDSTGFTAYLWAAEHNQAEFLDFLLARGANRHARTDDRTTALRVAANAGATRSIDFLLDHGDPVEGFPNDATTPLQSAAANARPAAVKLLLTRGAHPDRAARASSQSPPLIMAVRAFALAPAIQAAAAAKGNPLYSASKHTEDEYVEVLRALLDAGATIDLAGGHQDTALHLAAEHGLQKIAALLLERGARTDLANASGLTALEVARKKGQTALADLIAQHDARPRN
jgi:ankyrin repeat protein